MKTLKEQVNNILHLRIARICRVEYARINHDPMKKPKPYCVPQEVCAMVEMLGRIETSSPQDLEQMAAFAGSPDVLNAINARR